MQSGEYIINRLLPGFVRIACEKQSIDFTSFSDDWILRLRKNNQVAWVVGYKFDLNCSAAAYLAADKVAAYQILTDSGVTAVPHVLVRSMPGQKIERGLLVDTYDKQALVAKPLMGTGGRGVELFVDIDEAIQKIKSSQEPAWAVSPLLEVVREIRVTLLDGEVLLSYNKINPPLRGGLPMFNLGIGATARYEPRESLDNEVRVMAQNAARALGVRLAAVDIVQLKNGQRLVLEVNDGIMMENYARQSPEYREHAMYVYESIVNKLFAGN